jgi:murein L,D-transpeptidase YcbB/YkuD
VRQFVILKRLIYILPLVTVALAAGHGFVSARSRRTQSETSVRAAASSQQLSPQGQASLHAILQAGNLPDLRWPDFSDYALQLQRFYESYGYALPWVRGREPTSQSQQIIALLLKSEQKGLSREDYDGPRWGDRVARLKAASAQASELEEVRFDVALTVCAMRYISDLHIGKVNPKRLDFGFDVEAKRYDLPEFLKEHVVGASDVAGILAQVEPPYPGYRRTIQALATYLELAKDYDGKPLPAISKTVVPGDSYPGVPQLVRLLRLLGDFPADAGLPADGTVYHGVLVDAVKNFQRRHGRDADGHINAQTLADLNVPVTRRVRQIQLTLERWRWLPLANRTTPVVVNIPEFRLRAYDENFKSALAMNVVVGKAYGHGTPVFEDQMRYVIFRPYWAVPYSITRAELLPHVVRDPDYLAKKGFEVVNSRQEVITSGTVSNDVLAQLHRGTLFIRQTPGPKNSLGLVKFIFPNDFNVYLHDTPAHELFSRSRRDFSHGCIRLERPADLAVWVLRDNPGWSLDRVRAAMNGETMQQVNLAHPIPVLIVYGTAVVPEDGLVYFYDDIYGHDAALEKVLEKGYPYRN